MFKTDNAKKNSMVKIGWLLILFMSCAFEQSGRFSLDLVDHIPFYGHTDAQRGELIEAIPMGITSVAPIILDEFQSTGFKEYIGEELFDRVTESVVNLFLNENHSTNQIHFYRIHYWTEDINGIPIAVSALVLIPENENEDVIEISLIEINHATILEPNKAPTELNFSENTWAYLLTSAGNAVVVPDYPGYGDSASFHPYCQAEALGLSSADAIHATLKLFETENLRKVRFNGKVTIAGYSEGGYASLATLKELNKNGVNNFEIDMVIAMAAPVDMSGIMRNTILDQINYPKPFYLPFLLLGWRQMDTDLLAPTRLFKPWVVKEILPLYVGIYHHSVIDKRIKRDLGENALSELLTDEAKSWIVEPEASEEGMRLFEIMRANDLYSFDVADPTKIILMGSPSDEAVPFANSEKAYSSFIDLGYDTELIELSPENHDESFFEAWLEAFIIIQANDD
jgi:pimeloyl-ACP methyl ester carboxylesterase